MLSMLTQCISDKTKGGEQNMKRQIFIPAIAGYITAMVIVIFFKWFFSIYTFQTPIILRSPIKRIHVATPPIITPKARKMPKKARLTPTPTVTSLNSFKKYLTENGAQTREQVLKIAGETYSGDSLVAFDNIMKKEAGYRLDAINSSSGACGIAQAHPCEKMGCPLDQSGLECQTKWAIKYITNRYGDPLLAWNFHLGNGWY